MSSRPPNKTDERAFLSFRAGNQWYAVNVQSVFEVANLVAISAVPDMPDSVLGVVNVRGMVVPVLDLRIRFGMEKHTLDLATPIIFVHQDNLHTYGIVVDDVDDVITLEANTINQTPLEQRAKHIIGMVDHRDRLITLLDPLQLMLSSLQDHALEDVLENLDAHSGVE
jgi:purine-binding chemotaxis protein CheW